MNVKEVCRGLRDGSAGRRSQTEVLLVSHGSGLHGGAEFVFRDMALAIRDQHPSLRMAAVFPRRGELSSELRAKDIAPVIAPLPWWSTKCNSARPFYLELLAPAICFIPAVLVAAAVLLVKRPALVVTNTLTIPSFAIAAWMLRIPHYWLRHEYGRADHGMRFLVGYENSLNLMAKLSVTIICCSRALAEEFVAVTHASNVEVVHPAIHASVGVVARRKSDETLRAVLVGRYAVSKGQDLAIEAVALARDRGVDIRLDLVGPGDQSGARRLTRRLALDDLVSFHGQTEDVSPYWRNAHVALMCSNLEAFGRVTVEAMRSGLPVCGTDSGGTKELIEHGVNGLLSPAGDAIALSNNLIEIAGDEALRQSMARMAIASADEFQRPTYASRIGEILGLSEVGCE